LPSHSQGIHLDIRRRETLVRELRKGGIADSRSRPTTEHGPNLSEQKTTSGQQAGGQPGSAKSGMLTWGGRHLDDALVLGVRPRIAMRGRGAPANDPKNKKDHLGGRLSGPRQRKRQAGQARTAVSRPIEPHWEDGLIRNPSRLFWQSRGSPPARFQYLFRTYFL